MGQDWRGGQLHGMAIELDNDTSTTLLESLEFELPCGANTGCEHPAAAYLTLTCGHGWFTCDPHVAVARNMLEKLHAIAVLTNLPQSQCLQCGGNDPLVASVVPITPGDAPA